MRALIINAGDTGVLENVHWFRPASLSSGCTWQPAGRGEALPLAVAGYRCPNTETFNASEGRDLRATPWEHIKITGGSGGCVIEYSDDECEPYSGPPTPVGGSYADTPELLYTYSGVSLSETTLDLGSFPVTPYRELVLYIDNFQTASRGVVAHIPTPANGLVTFNWGSVPAFVTAQGSWVGIWSDRAVGTAPAGVGLVAIPVPPQVGIQLAPTTAGHPGTITISLYGRR
jgi:hypothetical protein